MSTYTRGNPVTQGNVTKYVGADTFQTPTPELIGDAEIVDFTQRESPSEFSLDLGSEPAPAPALVLPYDIPPWAAALGILGVLYLLQKK